MTNNTDRMEWGFSPDYGGFCFDIIDIHFNARNIQGRIIEIDKGILDLGVKYGLYKVYSNDRLNMIAPSSIGSYYAKQRSKSFWDKEQMKLDWYSIAAFHRYQLFFSTKLEEGYPKTDLISLSSEEKVETVAYSNLNPHSPPVLELDRDYFQLNSDTNDTKNSYLSIYSGCDIWFEEVISRKSYEWVDNRFFAYRNTPRFNSFFRDLVKICKKFGGHVSNDDPGFYRKYITSEGILLDNRLIYQEDIDSGRIKLPNLP